MAGIAELGSFAQNFGLFQRTEPISIWAPPEATARTSPVSSQASTYRPDSGTPTVSDLPDSQGAATEWQIPSTEAPVPAPRSITIQRMNEDPGFAHTVFVAARIGMNRS